jgi:hypothetical protein
MRTPRSAPPRLIRHRGLIGNCLRSPRSLRRSSQPRTATATTRSTAATATTSSFVRSRAKKSTILPCEGTEATDLTDMQSTEPLGQCHPLAHVAQSDMVAHT